MILLVAILLAMILFPIGFIVAMLYPKRKEYLFKIALGIDQLGNVVCSHLFNLTLIKQNGYKFGDEDETISSVIGKNKLKNTLTYTGKILDLLLDKIDKDHSINSIEDPL
jgi:hypothetical protein